MTNLASLLLSASPSRIALETPDGAVWSYGALAARARRYAGALHARGVGVGDRVIVQVEKSAEAVALYLGCLMRGAVFVPLNTAYTASERAYFITDAEPALVIVDPAAAKDTRAPAVETLDANGAGSIAALADSAPEEFETLARSDDDVAAILYTSGTTGRSKGAMLTHRNLSSNAQTLREAWRFTEDDVLLHALPIYHAHGLFVGLHVLLMAGAKLIFQPKFDVDQVIAALPRASVMMGVPTFYTRLLSDPRLTRDLVSHMRLFVSGSAPLLAETHRAFHARTGHHILERYGMTETGMNASNPYDGARIPGLVGPALAGVELRVVDQDTGALLGPGEIGMLEVRGPNVFKGYWRMPEKTAQDFRADGFFITGDLATIDADGYVQLVGRGKDLIISGGFNVYPKEIELEIDAVPGVLESAVIGAPHPDFGEAVVAVVARAPKTSASGADVTESEIMAALKDKLARFKQPKAVVFADDLPRNAMGKVQKNLLREAHKHLFATG